MGLDVYLKSEQPVIKKGTGIYVREDGHNRELSISEAHIKYPDKEISEKEYTTDNFFTGNITHNLSDMADKAGIYEYLWNPKEMGIEKAKDLIDPLREGLHRLKSDPKKYKRFNPPNGWGTYDSLVKFVSDYLDACYKYPNSNIFISR